MAAELVEKILESFDISMAAENVDCRRSEDRSLKCTFSRDKDFREFDDSLHRRVSFVSDNRRTFSNRRSFLLETPGDCFSTKKSVRFRFDTPNANVPLETDDLKRFL